MQPSDVAFKLKLLSMWESGRKEEVTHPAESWALRALQLQSGEGLTSCLWSNVSLDSKKHV